MIWGASDNGSSACCADKVHRQAGQKPAHRSCALGSVFIAPEDGQNDIFVHATALTRSGLSVLEEGQKVIFEAGQGKKGLEVRSIRLAE